MIDLAVTQQASPAAEIKRLANGFCHAKLLLAANELGVFADLHQHGPATEAELVERLPLQDRGARELLHGLVLLGLLEREDGRYHNSEATTTALIPGGPEYVGGFLRRADHMLYPAWENLTQALTTGKPQAPGAGPDAFLSMLDDDRQRDQFMQMMDSASGRLVDDLAGAFPWDAYRHIADVGGCRGNLAGQLLKRYPGLGATVFDLPPMAAPCADHMARLGVADRFRFHVGDFFTDELPAADVIILGHVLHDWSPAQRRFLVAKAFQAVNPGGALLVYDAMLTSEPTDLARILVSINMLLVTEDGSEYTVDEGRQWFAEADCTDVQVHPLGQTDTLLVGRKPAT